MVFQAIKDFFTPEPEEPIEVTLESMLNSQVREFFQAYSLELSGNKSITTYLVFPGETSSNYGHVALKGRVAFTTYSEQYDLTQLGIPYNAFEQQVASYFEQKHPLIQRELPKTT